MMHYSITIPLLGLLASITTASDPATLSKRIVDDDDPVAFYLASVCTPQVAAILNNRTRQTPSQYSDEVREASRTSLFPCERILYIQYGCMANGTTEIDFLAEQQCLCGGSYFELNLACRDCYLAHGFQPTDGSTPEQYKDSVKSTSIAECAPSPPFQPFSNLFPTDNIASDTLSPPMTLGDDKFPSNTAISNYFTSTVSAGDWGVISGSATARASLFPSGGLTRFTPTSVPPNSGIPTSTGPTVGTPSSGSPVTSPTKSANVGAGGERLSGGMLAAVVGVFALL